jgi:hypothetical protein
MNRGLSSTAVELPAYAVDQWQARAWRRPADGRFYHAELRQDLFGSWILIQRWGTLYSHRGRIIETPCPNYNAGLKRLQDIIKRRQQRGYEPES